MGQKKIMVVGTWDFKPSEKGFHVCSFDTETSEMELLARYDTDLNAGAQFYDPARKVLYLVDEITGRDGRDSGGGFIRAYRVNPDTGETVLINEKSTLLSKPAFCWMDGSGNYMMIAAHGGRAGVTKVARMSDGSYGSVTLHDDSGILLMRVKEDGSLGEICDAALYPDLSDAPGQVISHPHSVKANPSSEIWLACDKGLDMIYSYRLDIERGKILRLAETKMEFATAPRYLAYHPSLPVVYENNETGRYVYAFRYDSASGHLEELSRLPICGEEDTKSMASDIIVSADGRFVYCSVRKTSRIFVFRVDEKDGSLTQVQEFDAEYGIRGLCLSPDGRYLLGASDQAGEVISYAVGAEGRLSHTGKKLQADHAANIGFLE